MKPHKQRQHYVARRIEFIQQQAKARIVSVRCVGSVVRRVHAVGATSRDQCYRTTLEVVLDSPYGRICEDKARVLLGGSERALHCWLMTLPPETRIRLLQESLQDIMNPEPN